MDALHHIILAAILLVATVTDLRSRRIPNWLTFPAMLLALCLHGATQGWDGFLFSLSGLGLGLGVMLIPFVFGVMGAGDVKLMAAAGAFLGAAGVLKAFLFTSIAGGAYALIVLAIKPSLLVATLRNIRDTFGVFMATKQFSYTPAEGYGRLPKLAYGAAIAVGTVLSILHSGGTAAFVPGWAA